MVKISYLLLSVLSATIANAQETETIVDDKVTVENTKDEEIIIGVDNPADEADPWANEESYETSMMVEPVQAKLWSQIDFWMGVTWGLYVPFSSYARYDDCYSRFVEAADKLIDYHSRFD